VKIVNMMLSRESHCSHMLTLHFYMSWLFLHLIIILLSESLLIT